MNPWVVAYLLTGVAVYALSERLVIPVQRLRRRFWRDQHTAPYYWGVRALAALLIVALWPPTLVGTLARIWDSRRST